MACDELADLVALLRYVVNNPQPFIVNYHGERRPGGRLVGGQQVRGAVLPGGGLRSGAVLAAVRQCVVLPDGLA